jgi:uncharacterized membrane protein YbaN (DUF454 family)
MRLGAGTIGRTVVRAGRVTLGILCLALGVAGLFLPFLQGILLLVVGSALLSSESAYARRWSEWLRRHLPHKRIERLGEHADGRG